MVLARAAWAPVPPWRVLSPQVAHGGHHGHREFPHGWGPSDGRRIAKATRTETLLLDRPIRAPGGEFALSAVYHGARDIRAEERPIPEIGPRDVLIRPLYVGICGSDLEAYHKGGYAEGTILGHEFTGTVTEVGGEALGVQTGDYVTADSVLPCGTCPRCRIGRPSLCEDLVMVGIDSDGAMADYVRVPSWTVRKLPESIDPRYGPLIDPLSNIIHAVHTSAFRPGGTAAIVGAGPIGLLLTNFLKASGATRVAVFEVNPSRLKLASMLGADALVNPLVENAGSVADALTAGRGFDVVFVAAGVGKAAEMAYNLVGPGGEIVVVGIIEDVATADYLRLVLSEISVRGSYLGFNESPQAIDLMARGVIRGDVIVTNVVAGIERAIREVFPSLGKPDSLDGKVVVRIGGEG